MRAAAVSTVNAVVATSIPASSARARPVRNLSCDQASLLITGTFRRRLPTTWHQPGHMITLALT